LLKPKHVNNVQLAKMQTGFEQLVKDLNADTELPTYKPIQASSPETSPKRAYMRIIVKQKQQ
jgi:hypothetical protein